MKLIKNDAHECTELRRDEAEKKKERMTDYFECLKIEKNLDFSNSMREERDESATEARQERDEYCIDSLAQKRCANY